MYELAFWLLNFMPCFYEPSLLTKNLFMYENILFITLVHCALVYIIDILI